MLVQQTMAVAEYQRTQGTHHDDNVRNQEHHQHNCAPSQTISQMPKEIKLISAITIVRTQDSEREQAQEDDDSEPNQAHQRRNDHVGDGEHGSRKVLVLWNESAIVA